MRFRFSALRRRPKKPRDKKRRPLSGPHFRRGHRCFRGGRGRTDLLDRVAVLPENEAGDATICAREDGSMANSVADWSFGQFIGWAAGGAIGCGLGAGCQDYITALGDFQLIIFVTSLSAMYGAVGGLLGGAIGYGLAHFFHQPWSAWEMKSSFLFGLFLSLLVFSLISFPAAARYTSLLEHERLMIVAGFIGAVVAAGLGGVLNMLKTSRPS